MSKEVPVETYQLTATATVADTVTNYTGTKTADVMIAVTKKDIASLALSYDPIVTVPGTIVSEQAPSINAIPAKAGVKYTIATKTGTTTTDKHEGITIDETTGAISVSVEVSMASYQLTVTATADTAVNYEGTKTADVIVVVNHILVSEYELTYNTISTEYGREVKNQLPATNSIPMAAMIRYSIDKKIGTDVGKNTGIIINSVTGSISLSKFVPVATYQFTVTATPNGPGYTDTKTTDITIVVDKLNIASSHELSYLSTTTPLGTAVDIPVITDIKQRSV